jgi:Protein of unknown function (DUF3800)
MDAYLDESGIHDGAPICVIAGYFGEPETWSQFADGWRRIFATCEMVMEEFHAKDLVKKTGSEYKSLAQSLTGLVADFASEIHPVSAAIIVKDFEAFSLDDRKFMTGATLRDGQLRGSGSPDKPYYIPFQHCLKHIAKYAPARQTTNFFFGLDRTFSDYAKLLYAQAKADPHSPFRETLGDIAFPLAKNTPQLQAADLLVHLGYLYALERMEENTWGQIQPGPLLMFALAGTLDQADHTVQDKQCLIETITKGLPDFLKRVQRASTIGQ